MLEKDKKNILVKASPICSRCNGNHYDFYCVYYKLN